jgi:type VI secretion system protein ImpF
LDRLTDDARQRKEESRDGRVLSMRRLRQCVIRDLETLFNCPAPSSDQRYDDYPLVSTSVLNYGIPGLAGCWASGLDIPVLERRIRQAIWDFEPRLKRSSVKVHAEVDEDKNGLQEMIFVIDAEIWSYPQPEQLTLSAGVALESGQVVIRELSGREGR